MFLTDILWLEIRSLPLFFVITKNKTKKNKLQNQLKKTTCHIFSKHVFYLKIIINCAHYSVKMLII